MHASEGRCGGMGKHPPVKKTGFPPERANRLGSRKFWDARTYARAAAGKDAETAATLAGWLSRHPIPEGRSRPRSGCEATAAGLDCLLCPALGGRSKPQEPPERPQKPPPLSALPRAGRPQQAPGVA